MAPYLLALLEDATIKAEKRNREAEAEALEMCKRRRQVRKREKKAERLDHKELGRSITPSIDTEEMTTTASNRIEAHASVGGPSHYGDAEASSNVGKSQWWTLPCSWRSWSTTWGMLRLRFHPLRLPRWLGMARGSGAGSVATSGAPNAIGALLGERVGGSSLPHTFGSSGASN
jgi:hypothetical protein